MKHKQYAENAVTYFLLFLLCIIMSLPIISMVGTSLKTQAGALSALSIFPKAGEAYWGNFATVMRKTSFALNIWNSAVVSILSAALCVVLAALAGYALSRFANRPFKIFAAMLLVLQMMPLILVLVPTFVIYKSVGLNNTLTGLIINYTAGNIAFSIWMIKGFFDSVPFEIEEAAMIDGCSRFKAFLKVILPISSPGISTVAIFAFVRAWNEYMVSRILIQSNSLKTINLGLQQFVQQYTVDWSLLSAAAVIATIPTIFFLVFAQKYLVQGLTAGSVKG